MKRLFRWLALSSLACAGSGSGFSFVFGCAGAGAGARGANGVQETHVQAPPGQNETAELRRASSPIARRWPFRKAPSFTLYADLAGFTKTEVFRTFAASALTMARGRLDEEQSGCVRALFEGARELAVGYEKSDGSYLVVLSLSPELRKRASECVPRLGVKPGPAIAGAREVHLVDKDLLAFDDTGIAVFGSKSRVEEAFSAGAGSGAGAGPAVGLTGDEYIAWSGTFPELDVSGRLACSQERFKLSVAIDARDAELLARLGALSDRSRQVDGAMPGDEESRVARILLDAVKIQQTGKHFDVSFEIVKPPDGQARDIGMAAALGIHGVRRYLSRAKQSEALNSLAAISRSYQAWWEREEVGVAAGSGGGAKRMRKPKKLFSLIPVPTEVPSGKKYQSAEGEWKAWQDIGFSIGDPQYYQYEVKAAKDGKSAEIIARGDLDGDGKKSTFTLRMQVDAKSNTLVVAPQIDQVEPDE